MGEGGIRGEYQGKGYEVHPTSIPHLVTAFGYARTLGIAFSLDISGYMENALNYLRMENIPAFLKSLSENKPILLDSAVSLALKSMMDRLYKKPLDEEKGYFVFEVAVQYNRFDQVDAFTKLLGSCSVHPRLYTHLMASILKVNFTRHQPVFAATGQAPNLYGATSASGYKYIPLPIRGRLDGCQARRICQEYASS